jgi:hypothetical protein
LASSSSRDIIVGMMSLILRSVLASTFLLVAGCGDNTTKAPDFAVSVDLAAGGGDMAVSTGPDLAQQTFPDGSVNNGGDGGAACGSSVNYQTRYEGNRMCNANMAGGAAGAPCTTGAQCAEVCCTCDNNSTHKYMAGLCSDGKCNPAAACQCTDVPAKLAADNVCP